ncbi:MULTISPECIES: bifunctional 4-hydroxy-2-oxoglutarate aldolase/2-dehydro-3-deoxy-phosphogluconate aldolase [unclassified Actinomyces]|uniref:bifunctional 4-hydroxy-2-oxoglutarate aldolase/2-dehydro-3-deoxy-phosphogluconate aldolase n=1 Tax=unclassified Actinomyces TaxID=2609248 RepID=UPI002018392E|nr:MULTISPECIES: bifunctional 4-hydroxy-2-oxoglutarate aldolase/2-dehydro-3-deoxy-phosphogluconate aldolase [unclassified Actinomyces]MCL3777316.1 bifunctional 4-hydroxy-2-oxoglutarate aldolase/2-dehydro-3-deoxy-phosphogluconate aldolase [Actinomyces sp. AC-20-1]MCL3790408.1 bifunctional 4-hydroxy-2-oxoglutarate aldolase/2-dehydro-3-deoxy-phosphogluconate aldolase [Actinomyces sp. 187325]MCL3792683.1 bifunctional 4-hydroxy-2-oxoglutarate aldolase/2-dehydro-3-deoxy-phosphogluconate aldolase [Acti
MDALTMLRANPVVPVVVVDSAEEGLAVGRALVAGGIHTAEVTFRTAAGAEAIRAMSEIEGLTVGAGTVITPAQVATARAAGAQYIVSPGFSADVVKATLDAGLVSLPACSDASWMMRALELGIEVVKFFPAGVLGGMSAIKSYAAPFPTLKFLPSGGVSAANLGEYLSSPVIAAASGSWMVSKDLIKAGDWDEVTRLSAQAITIAKESGR